MVVDALRQKIVNMGSLTYLRVARQSLAREIQTLAMQYIRWCV